ncbi:glycosyltransferase [Candidatus Thiothrix sp. Deng01]|uniref:Glycosyltransferase n=1 Tax=Candidatus Thiothrix phosphatis TaxID=3112415 RepID=A0ABU6CW57_9GAMM|nr:glycosyltransferase [Candidatus Thiothrix sp. Deng01]MEB4590359.1 glycosyltransferase [Candidatus Thiothrix sp. Deng01]
MNMIKPSICLNMIVKNESETITRCFDSVKEIIDYWVISDTGSTDGTQQIITEYFKRHNIPGLLIENEWKNFGHNRTLALEHALNKADYILIMDADDFLSKSDGFNLNMLSADSYMLKMQRSGFSYYNTRLVRGHLPWKWHGVLHEYLDCQQPHTTEQLQGDYIIQSTTDGARSQNPEKYKNDIKVLEAALLEEPDNARYQFYLAQSYRDDGNLEQAIVHYQKRANMGGWAEEVFYSLLEVAHNKRRTGVSGQEVINDYLKAHFYRPQRLEALYEAVRLCRLNGHFHLGYQLGHTVKQTPLPDDVLFLNPSVYDWRFQDELSICAVYADHPQEAAQMIEILINLPKTPTGEKQRLASNLSFAKSLL